MDLNKLKKFSRNMRVKLIEQIEQRLNYIVGVEDEYTRAHTGEIKTINKLIEKEGKNQFLEEVAYTWFNRLAALRYMDEKGYNKTKIVSPTEGESQSQLLALIKQGKLPEEIKKVSDQVFGYLDGKIKAQQPDREAYRTALLAMCNDLGRILPFLFKQVDDWVALLLPTDLLSPQSVIADFREGMGEEDCKEVQIIGWLYQFYISEKKDNVFADLGKNKKMKKENIPAATQLFTPHWIVQYMVENSLGRLWLHNNPTSKIKAKMEFYLDPDEEETFIHIEDPSEIRVLDPACGSGHILLYAFDLLYKLYEEEGYTSSDIPSLILKHNLFGIDIDERASELAAFALMMKAREYDRFFFKKEVFPNIITSEEVNVDLHRLGIRFSPDLQNIFTYLKNVKTIGSLVPVEYTDVDAVKKEIDQVRSALSKVPRDELFDNEAIEQVVRGLKQIECLLPKYHCVIMNPPYLGKGMTPELKEFVKNKFPDSKSDLFAVFIEHGLDLLKKKGYLAMITQQSWMFLSRYEKLRMKIIDRTYIVNMVHLGPRAFDTIGGEVVQSTSFVLQR